MREDFAGVVYWYNMLLCQSRDGEFDSHHPHLLISWRHYETSETEGSFEAQVVWKR